MIVPLSLRYHYFSSNNFEINAQKGVYSSIIFETVQDWEAETVRLYYLRVKDNETSLRQSSFCAKVTETSLIAEQFKIQTFITINKSTTYGG
jgi:hypothetical protein